MVDLVKYGPGDLHEDIVSGRTSIHRAHEILHARASRDTCGDRNGGASDVSYRRELAHDPMQTLRMVATLIPGWIEKADGWTVDHQTEFVRALRNVVDSCELAFRRLLQRAEHATE